MHGANWKWDQCVARIVLVCLPAIMDVVSSRAVAAERITLTAGAGLKGWRAPVGDWQQARAVSSDSANGKRFSIEPGEGVFVNGAKGTTKNLLSEFEHGDVEAHIEFMVPKDSNSGV